MGRILLLAAWVAIRAPGATIDDARAALLRGQYDKAAELLAPLVRQSPGDTGLRLNYGLALQSSGQYAAAQRELSRVVKERPGNAQAWLLLGLSYQKQEQPGLAIEPLKRALTLHPDERFTEMELADAYLAAGQANHAAEHFGRLTATDPQSAKAWQGLGLAHLSMAKHRPETSAVEEARAHQAFDMLTTLPESAELHELLAEADAQQGRRQEAVDEWKRAVALDPNTRRVARLAEALWSERSYEEAEPLLQQIVKADPQQPRWQYLLGDVLFRERRSEEALPHLEAAVRMKPGQLEAQAALGRVYLQLDKPAVAIPHLEKGLSTDPEAIGFQLRQARSKTAK